MNLREQYEGRRVGVTGGAGFIGSHIVDALVELGAETVVLDDLSTGTMDNLADHGDRIAVHVGSILDADLLRSVLAGCSVVFHQAAMTSVPQSVNAPRETFEVNARGTMDVLEAARELDIPRVVFASSSSVYGDQPTSPKTERMYPQPLSPYAASKLVGEHLLAAYASTYGIEGVSLRYFNIFGARQRPDSAYAAAIPRFLDAMLRNQPLTIFGDGTQSRDFTHIDNVVHANLHAGAAPGPLRGEPLNIACGQAQNLNDMVRFLGEQLDLEPDIRYEPHRVGDVLHSLADVSAASECIGYTPQVPMERGIELTIPWYRAFVQG